MAEHAGTDAVRADIEAFLAANVLPDGSYDIRNPFRIAIGRPTAAGGF